MKRFLALLLLMLLMIPTALAYGQEPSREDIGDLIVLHLYGSYQEMGKQEAELLGPILQNVYEFQLADFKNYTSEAGVRGRIFNNILLPIYSMVAPVSDASSFYAEIGGMASGLGVPRRNVIRGLYSLAGGSTVFAATRSATADGQALIGRNVDWGDAFGRRRPVVAFYHPTNGDLDYIFAGWPLVGLPTIGVNEAGLATSFNFFISEPRVSLFFPSWPHRRVLQKATTVDEAIEIIKKSHRRGLSAFWVLADATGDIAMVEWTPNDMAVFRPHGDWFAQANHARTERMIQYDRYRHPDSFQRRAAMEAAVEPHLGHLNPELAVQILRDRHGADFANEPSVANTNVLNSAVVHPASRTLWHSTVMQPHAPFGSFVPFTLSESATPESIPASEALTSGALKLEQKEIRAARHALELHHNGDLAEAREAWDALLASEPVTLNVRRLALGSAATRDALKDNEGAYAVLEQATDAEAPFDVRGTALVARGILADRLALRNEAINDYEEAIRHFNSRPEFTAFDPLKKTAVRGLKRSQAKEPLPISPYDVGLPQ